MNELISVIVPVYNVEKYLRKCVDSIINQTYKNLEIILVDDGSPDKSGDVCDEYAKQDSRIRVIHKTNGGLSDARNTGLDIANGEYIMFVDSDDYIETNMCETLYNRLISDKTDMAICSVLNVDTVGKKTETGANITLTDDILTTNEALEKLGSDCACAYVVACNKLYIRALWNDFRYPIGKLHEDEFVAHNIIGKCNRVSTVSKTLYNYLQRNDSIMNSVYSVRRLDGSEAYIARLQYMLERNLVAALPRIIHLTINTLLEGYNELDLSDKINRNRLKGLKRDFSNLYFKLINKIPIKTKIHLTVFITSPKIYRFLINSFFSEKGV